MEGDDSKRSVFVAARHWKAWRADTLLRTVEEEEEEEEEEDAAEAAAAVAAAATTTAKKKAQISVPALAKAQVRSPLGFDLS